MRAQDFISKVDEIQILSRVKGKGSDLSQLPKRGRPVKPGEENKYLGRKILDWQGYEIYREFFGGQLTYTLFDPDTRRSVVTAFGSRYQQNPDSFVIAGLYAAPDNTVRAAEFYRILVQDLGVTLISDNKQSAGGQRVWQQLERFPGIEIYGFDARTGEVMNFGSKDAEMYAVASDAAKNRENKYVAKNIRLVATTK